MQTPEEKIQLVKKWLDNPESVSKEELRKAADAHDTASYYSSVFFPLDEVAGYAVGEAVSAVDSLAGWVIRAHSDNAAYYVKEYEKLAQKEG